MEESAFKPAFLLPYFNHPARIAELVHALAPIAPVLIVDDGSDEASKSALKGLTAKIYTRAQNGGKGAAVCDGLAWAKEVGFTHAFQIDADFQHDVSRCEEFLALAAQQPFALICAAPAYDESAPKSRLHGRKIMNFWCVINTLSYRIKDAMCGFRIYPLEGIVPLLPRTKSRRMGFDAEILILAVRAGLEIKWLDLAVRYETGGVSHFAPFRDNLGISLMHARLFCGLPLWLAKRALERGCDKFKKRDLQEASQQSANEILQGLAEQNLCSGARRDSCKGAKKEMDGGADEKAGTEKCGDKAAAQSSQVENSAQSSLVKASRQSAAAKDGRDG